MSQYKQLYETTNSKLSEIMSEHLEMTDLKKQFESWALIAEEMLRDKEAKLTETEIVLKSTS